MPTTQQLAFLPAFFVNLDPAGIPTSAELEVFAPYTGDTISRAVISLDVISHIYPPLDVGVSFWPRVWPWVRFIHTNWDQLSGVPLPPQLTFYMDFIKLLDSSMTIRKLTL